jgi:hypothetical protein
MEIVNAFFVLHPQKNEQAAGHSQGQPCNVDRSMDFMADDVSPGYFYVVFKHGN